ncbi:MAG: hypothetical protein VCA35_06265 [Roseibacillus sp.]
MKTVSILLALASLTMTASAVDYGTLTTATASKNVTAGDLVEVMGTNKNNYGTADSIDGNCESR